MKKLLLSLLLIPAFCMFFACDSKEKDVWDSYADWREENEAWIAEMARMETPEGKAYYQRIVPTWNPGVYILMHWFNDRALTEDNLVPLETSTVLVKYSGKLYNTSEPFDSSYSNRSTIYGDSVFLTSVESVVTGWQIALQTMHVGDSVEIIVPYNVGYGANTSIDAIPPYSALKFNIKLVDIPYYEVKP